MKQKPVVVRMLKTHYPHWGQRTAFNAFLRYFDRRAFAVIMEEVPMGNGELLPKPFSRLPGLPRHGKKPQEYGWQDLKAEVRMFRRAFLGRIDVMHFIDAEHSLYFLPCWFQKFGHLKKFPKIIAMFHQPPAILEKIINKETACAADLVLTVSPEQADFFARFLPAERISTILLGVDTEYFKPLAAKKSQQEFKCLAGGVWLRDYPAILKTAELLAAIPEIEFHLVAPQGQFRALPGNVVIHSGINDAALLDLYQNCHVLFLPLKDATANTFLLEGCACGLPIVSSALPSLKTYFPGAEAILVPGNDPQVFARHLLELYRDPQRLSDMSGHARRRALHLSWEKIVPEYERLYRELAGTSEGPEEKKISGGQGRLARRPGASATRCGWKRMMQTVQAVKFIQDKGGFFDLEINESDIVRWSDEFRNVYARRPIVDNVGGIGPVSSAWLFLTAKAVNPELIIESGAWHGHSSWLLRQACPTAEIHSFDLNLSLLLQRGERVVYHEKDWTRHRFEHVNPERSLLFFDDHVNQARRVGESFARGFRFLVFDDNVPPDKAQCAGLPPFPTIQMLFDEGIHFGERFPWQTARGETRYYEYLEKDAGGAKALIENHFVYPGTPTYLSFVKLIRDVK